MCIWMKRMTISSTGKAFVMFLTERESLLLAIRSKSLKLGGKYIVTENIVSTKMESNGSLKFIYYKCYCIQTLW